MPGWRTGRRSFGNYDQNMGRPGVVYILENDGLRAGWVKIGCSSRSGAARASDLNADANTGTPGTFRCVYELHTQDCGLAERKVFAELSRHRRGKWGQEFFEVEQAYAREVIERACRAIDQLASLRPPAPPPPSLPPLPPLAFDLPSPRRVPSTAPHPWERPPMPPKRRKSPVRLRWIAILLVALAFMWFRSTPSQAPTQRVAGLAAPKMPTSPHTPSKRSKHAGAALQPIPASVPLLPAPAGAAADAPALPGPAEAELDAEERSSIEAACSPDKYGGEPPALNACRQRLLDQLAAAPPRVDLSGLTPLERTSMTSACSHDKYTLGPAALRSCLARQVTRLKEGPPPPDLSQLSRDIRMSIDAACSHAKYTLGPADFYRCASRHLAQLGIPAR
jgi:hypothetical protein